MGMDSGAVTGKGKVPGIDQSEADGGNDGIRNCGKRTIAGS